MGICTYTLSKLCNNATSLLYFNIEAKNEPCNGNPTVSYIHRVMVDVYDHKITIVKNESSRVLVDGMWTNLPVILVNPSLTVKQSGRYVILEAKLYEFYLTVSYDTDHTVDVRIPMTYSNQTCGMCGNFNGIRHDDFMMPDGQLAQNSNQLGDSWKVEYDDSLCSTIVPTPSPSCPPDIEELYSNNQFCGLLTMKDGPFKTCHSVIKADYFFDSCVVDLCALGNDSLCKALEAYADTCQREEVILAWRNSTFCSIPCSANSHYNSCTSACPATCQDQNAQSNCSKPCTDACECDNGFVLSGPTCVPISECGCFYDGKYYQKNEIFWKGDCNSQCTCQGNNNVNCTTQTCDPEEVCKVHNGIKACFPADISICHIYGDPHYITFDGESYHFQGACNYTAVETCGNTSVYFLITTRNEHRGSLNWTAINSVAVRFIDLYIILGKNKVVEINGHMISLPWTPPAPGISIDLSGSFVVVQTGFGLEVKFSGDHELFVRVNENFKGKLCGLCGTYNGNQQDDFLTPGGVLARTSNEFGISWRVPDDNWVCEDDIVDPSPCDTDEKKNYKDKCKLILASNGPFKGCHPQVVPQIYFDNCVYDLCATGGNQYKFCNALEAYAAICDNTGIVVGDWRENNTCRITTTTIIPTVSGSTTAPSRDSTFESLTTTFITTTTVTPPHITTMDTPTSVTTTSSNPTSTMTTKFTPISCDTSLPSSSLTKTTLPYIPSTAITPSSSSPVTTRYTTSSTTASTMTSLQSATNPTEFSTSSSPYAPSQDQTTAVTTKMALSSNTPGSTTASSRVSTSFLSTSFEPFSTTSTTTATATPTFTTTMDAPNSVTTTVSDPTSTMPTASTSTSSVSSLPSSSFLTTNLPYLSSTTSILPFSSSVTTTTLYPTSSAAAFTTNPTTVSTASRPYTSSPDQTTTATTKMPLSSNIPGSTTTSSKVSTSFASTFFEPFTTTSTTTATATPTFTTTMDAPNSVTTAESNPTFTMPMASTSTSSVSSLPSSSFITTNLPYLSSTTSTLPFSSSVTTTTLYPTSSATASTTNPTTVSTALRPYTSSPGSTTTSSRVSTYFSSTSFKPFTTTSSTTATANPTFTTTTDAPNYVTTAVSNPTSTMTTAFTSTSSVPCLPSSSFTTTNLPHLSSTTSTPPFSSSVTTTTLYPTSSPMASTTNPTAVSTASRPYISSPGSTTTSSRVSTYFSSTSFEPFTTTTTTTATATPTFTTTMDAPNSVTTAASSPTSTMTTASTSTSSVSSLPFLSSTTSTLPFSSSVTTTTLYPASSATASITNPTADSTASRPYTSSPDQTTTATTKMALSSNTPDELWGLASTAAKITGEIKSDLQNIGQRIEAIESKLDVTAAVANQNSDLIHSMQDQLDTALSRIDDLENRFFAIRDGASMTLFENGNLLLGARNFLLLETHFPSRYSPPFLHANYPQFFLANAENKTRGVAVLLARDCNFTLTSVFKDPDGRFILVKGLVEGQLYSLISYYAPNKGQDKFFVKLFHTLNPMLEGKVILGGDSNVTFEQELDRTRPLGQQLIRPRKVSHRIAKLLHSQGLTDAWRELNPSTRDYTHYSAPHNTYARIDHLFVQSHALPAAERSLIIDTVLSDHAIVALYQRLTSQSTGFKTWRLNESLLTDPSRIPELELALQDYFKRNTPKDTSMETVWAAHKTVIRGEFIKLATHLKRERTSAITRLELEYANLRAEHKKKPLKENIPQLDKIKLELNLALTTRAEKSIRWSGNKFYTQKDKIGSMLASKLSPKQRAHSMPHIRLPGEGLSSNPTKVLEAFQIFYSDLYSAPKTDPLDDINSFLDTLPIPRISNAHREVLEAPFTEEEVLATVKELKNNSAPGPDGLSNAYYKN
ncbi:uncharacterized protein LOC143986718 [Lithobates pipiens]